VSGAAAGYTLPLDETVGSRLRRRNMLVVGAVIVACSAVALAAILLRNGGHFAYTLDAAYIHLSLASHIAAGTYGINSGESASPSSTIVYPFLLAAMLPLGLGQFSALLISLVSTLASGMLLCLLAEEAGLELDRLGTPSLALLAVAVLMATNLVGLAFTGLEHSLHVALSLASLLGLARFVRRRQSDWWWLVCIALQPLVRFEAAVLLFADIALLVMFRRYGHALIALAIGVVGVGGFGWYLHAHGLSWLPNSVLSRSAVATNGLAIGQGSLPASLLAFAGSVARNLNTNLSAYGGTQIAIVVAALAAWFSHPVGVLDRIRRDPACASVAAFAGLVCVAQLAGGSLASFSRYEIYALVLGLSAMAMIYRDGLNRWLREATRLGHVIVALSLVLVFSGYVRHGLLTAAAAGNVYEQQFQMRRFAVDFYDGPVAVNHLGWVNYENPRYVLDLSGAGSDAAREAIARGRGPGWVQPMVADHKIGLAMIYPNLVPALPTSWQPLARLDISGTVHTVPGPSVVFYSTNPASRDAIVADLERFAPTLPAGVRLRMGVTPEELSCMRDRFGAGQC
jgi:hypothetical protein